MVAALACALGLHWSLLQSVAWVGMVVSYSHDASLGEALEKTFDGKHPCALCKTIAAGKKSEKKSPFQSAGKKFEFSYSPTAFVFSGPAWFWTVGGLDEKPALPSRAPPVPPPKSLLG